MTVQQIQQLLSSPTTTPEARRVLERELEILTREAIDWRRVK